MARSMANFSKLGLPSRSYASHLPLQIIGTALSLVPTCSESVSWAGSWEKNGCWVKYQKPGLRSCLALPLFACETTSGGLDVLICNEEIGLFNF